MPPAQTCKFCRWWHHYYSSGNGWREGVMNAQCRFDGPRLVERQSRDDHTACWPMTRSDDFCSHFSTINARAEDA